MKHLKLLAGLVCLSLVLSGCDDSGKKPKNVVGSDGLTYSSESIFDPNVVKTNIEVEEADDPTPEFKTLLNDHVFDTSKVMADYGTILKVKNEQGYVGFYSKVHDDYIIEPYLVPDTFTQTTYSVGGLGTLLQLKYEDTYFIYDAFGNLLDNYEYPISSVQGATVVNKMTYLTYTYSDLSFTQKIFEYDKHGSATEVPAIPEEIDIPEDIEEYTGPRLNDIFTYGSIELDAYGLPGYRMIENGHGYITVFENGKAISSFYVGDNGVTLAGVVGSTIYYQIVTQLSERLDDFSFMIGNNKYYLETYKVDISTGKTESMAINALFDTITPLKDSNENVNLYLAFYRQITSVRTLGQRIQRVVDKDFVFHDDVSGIAFGTLRHIDENRYIDGYGVLYDEHLKPITYLTYLGNRQLHLNQKVFSGYVRDNNGNNKYGLVDFDGRTVVEFIYDTIYTNLGKDGKYIAVKDDKVYRITAGSDDVEYLGTNLTTISTNLFRATSLVNQEYRYFTTSENLFTIDNAYPLTVSSTTLLGKAVYMVRYSLVDELDEFVTNYHYFVAANEELDLHDIPESTKGSARTDKLYYGSSYNNALPVTTDGFSKVHILSGYNYRYVTFDVTTDNYLGVFLDSNITSCTVYRKKTSDPTSSFSNIGLTVLDYYLAHEEQGIETDKVLIIPNEADWTYAIRLYCSTNQLVNILVDNIDGMFTQTAVDAGIIGLGAPILLNTPKHIDGLFHLFVKMRSLNDVYYSISFSGANVHLYDVIDMNTSAYILENNKIRIAPQTSARTYDFFFDTSLDHNTGLSLTLAESLDGSFVTGQSVGSPIAISMETTDPLSVSRNENNNGYGFAKFTPALGGQYSIKSTFNASVTQLSFFAFNANRELTGEYSLSSVTSYTYSMNVEEGGFVIVRFLFTTTSINYTPLITGVAGKSEANPSALSTTAAIRGTVTVNNTYEYQYYSLTDLNYSGKYSIVVSEYDEFESYYKLAGEASFTKFDGSFSFVGTDLAPVSYVVKLVFKKSMTFYHSAALLEYINETITTGIGGDAITRTSFTDGSILKIKYTNHKNTLAHVVFSSSSSLSVFVSTMGFATDTITGTTYGFDQIFNLKSNENLYVTIKNNTGATVSNLSIDVEDFEEPLAISSYAPGDIDVDFGWSSYSGLYDAGSLLDNEVAEMYFTANIHGKVYVYVNMGKHGTLEVYKQTPNSYGEYLYGNRSLFTSYTATTEGEFVLLNLGSLSVGQRVIFRYTEAVSSTKPGISAQIKDISYIHI